MFFFSLRCYTRKRKRVLYEHPVEKGKKEMSENAFTVSKRHTENKT